MTLDGPFLVLDYSAGVTATDPVTKLPVTTYAAKPGVHYNTTAADLAAHPELSAYVVAPAPLQRVWAGDDPVKPTWTVALRFPDQATADAILVALA